MDLHAPVAGNLLLFGRDDHGSSVVLLDGTLVGHLQGGPPLTEIRFTITDADRQRVAAGARGDNRRQTRVWSADRATALTLVGGWSSRSQLVLPSGPALTVWTDYYRGRSPVLDADGVEVATVRAFDRVAWHYGPYAVDLLTPLLSVVQAAGLAEYVRKRIGAALEPCG